MAPDVVFAGGDVQVSDNGKRSVRVTLSKLSRQAFEKVELVVELGIDCAIWLIAARRYVKVLHLYSSYHCTNNPGMAFPADGQGRRIFEG